MVNQASLSVELVGCSNFLPPSSVDFATEAQGGEALIEFAGRACYESFDKSNPRTRDYDAYIRHVLEVGHMALFEHATATVYIRGISRVAAAELMRHRHFSCSQLSQRYVHDDNPVIVPPLVAADDALLSLFQRAADESRFAYKELLSALEQRLTDEHGENNALLRMKQARQAARMILPGATESRLVVTGNFRTWRHFIGMRASEHADVEIRTVAVEICRLLSDQAPTAFGDFQIDSLPDGSLMATSPYVTDF